MFGNYRTQTFSEIYETVESFLEDYNNVGIPTTIKDENVMTLYYLLYAKFGNSHTANLDMNQFKYKIFSLIYSYGPTWEKKLDIQKKLREMSEDELLQGNKTISNHAYNDSTEPSTNSTEETLYVNSQDTMHNRRSKLTAYASLWDILRADVTEQFLGHFKKLFLTIVQPYKPLWYVTNLDEEE